MASFNQYDLYYRMQFDDKALSSAEISSHHSTLLSSNSSLYALKYNLFPRNLDDNYVTAQSTKSSTSSEEGNSPTELNNCRRIFEMPPLVSVIHF